MQYCTFLDIVNLATEFRRDYNDNLFTVEQRNDVLDRAGDEMRTLLHPHYALSVIDGYAPDFPPAVRRLAAFIGARILVESYQTSMSPPQSDQLLSRWDQSSMAYRDEIYNVSLMDAAGDRVPRAAGPARLTLESTDALTEVADGRFY